MPSGGYRPGAGRPPGTGGKPVKKAEPRRPGARKTPLEYMLDVMNDEAVDVSRRDRMSIAAAPYCHGRAVEDEKDKGKKAQRQADAKTAQAGTSWESDLPAAPTQ